MFWHDQVTSIKLRGYETPDGYVKRRPWGAVGDVELFGDGRAFAHGFGRLDGDPLKRKDFLEIKKILYNKYKVHTVLTERNEESKEYDTRPGELR